MSDDFVLAELKALKDADSVIEAGPEVERRVLKAVRHRRVMRSCSRAAALAVLAGGATFAILAMRAPRTAVPVASLPVEPMAVASVAETPLPAKAVKPAVRAKRTVKASREVATEFFPRIDTPPPFERGEIMRVVVPASTMRKVGLPVGENHLDDPIQADILVGQEGLARAIRFVNYQQ